MQYNAANQKTQAAAQKTQQKHQIFSKAVCTAGQ